jgi:hypothetical protein
MTNAMCNGWFFFFSFSTPSDLGLLLLFSARDLFAFGWPRMGFPEHISCILECSAFVFSSLHVFFCFSSFSFLESFCDFSTPRLLWLQKRDSKMYWWLCMDWDLQQIEVQVNLIEKLDNFVQLDLLKFFSSFLTCNQ